MNQREIKFRAWHKADKQILPVIGLFYNPDTMQLMDVNVGDSETVDWRDQSDVILMQYTGLNDKDGQEIYEGDILNGPLGIEMVVRWDDEEAAYFMREADEPGYSLDRRETGDHIVIGNIYQNPELLQQ